MMVLLFTPALSSRLLSPSGPTSTLQTLLARIFGRSLKHQFGASISGIRVVSAVVDALPAPKTGHIAEGFSYMILTPDGEQDLVIVPDQADQDEEGTLEFKFSDKWHQDVKSKTNPAWGLTDYRVAIKLANTLFLSGRKKTFLDAKYLVDPAGDLHLAHHEWLAHCSIPYHASEHRFLNNFDERVLKTDKLLNLSLVPLTEPRKISVSLGNILRTVELPDGSQRPASHELEANLESYFRTTEQQPHPRPVWALLTDESGVERSRLVFHNAKFMDALSAEPSQRSGLEIMWSKPDLEASDEYNLPLRESIVLDGAKLQRVLSGGGGWGDKAGLLALDPHDLIQTPRKNEEEISQFSSDNSDYTHVQFFTSTNSPAPQLFQYRQGFHMGVVPDGTPKWVPPVKSREKDIYSMSFVALSYEGMSFRTNTSINEANFPTLQEHPKETTRTKVDVPFASFTYLRAEPFSDLDRTSIRPTELVDLGQSVLRTGYKLLRYVCDTFWVVLRDSSIALDRDAKVDLRTRRDQIMPVTDSLIQILMTVSPGGVAYLSRGISRFNTMADTSKEKRQRQEFAKTHKEILSTINSTTTFIDRAATQISMSLRRSQEDVKWTHEFDVGARQRSLAAVYTDLIRIIGDIKPMLLDNYHNGMRRTMIVVVSYRIFYYHNEWHQTKAFIRKAHEQIDDSKRALGVPITHYEGTTGAGAETVAGELRGLLGEESEGQSEQNLSEMKQTGGAKQGVKQGGEESL
ncbi:uncharacterized protein J3D65DRAFT_642657 [Phyllosticta citribraziliensis]|uniref:Uncharacterized protein n=1 Tax=Phyllosticta citribraziliensis TaxID=989973 RepID=A0ABR1L4N7_9PEZI